MMDCQDRRERAEICGIVTCSFRRDVDLFALLAESVDRFVAPGTPHLVVVPGKDRALFKQFETGRRTIVDQEAFLPAGVRHLPRAPGALARLIPALRRNAYASPSLGLIRGWILQQIVKIEVTRRLDWAAVLHVDSDAAFVRPFDPASLVRGGAVRLYSVDGPPPTPAHARWRRSAEAVLGLPETPFMTDYVDSLTSWRPATVRALAEHVAATAGGKDWRAVLMRLQTLSEYILYGTFVDHGLAAPGEHWHDAQSLCLTVWGDQGDPARLLEALHPRYVALAVQSTVPLPLDARRDLLARAEAEASAMP